MVNSVNNNTDDHDDGDTNSDDDTNSDGDTHSNSTDSLCCCHKGFIIFKVIFIGLFTIENGILMTQ